MHGLVPCIQGLKLIAKQTVDGRNKSGHDDEHEDDPGPC